MKIINTKFKGLKIIKQKIFKDRRGFLRVTHNQKLVNKKFIFEYCTNSKKNSLRGFHFQHKYTQAKYVNVIKGKILDCVLDLRKNSKTFGKSFKIILSDKNNLGLYIPEGFAHGFCVLSNYAIMHYVCSEKRYKEYEECLNWNDKDLKIKWPIKKPILSIKDSLGISFSNY